MRNRARGTQDYIEVTKRDRLVVEDHPELKSLTVRNEFGQRFLRLHGDDERCVGLEGDVGEGVRCTLYKWRPRGCRNVESGDEECLRARRQFGLTTEPVC